MYSYSKDSSAKNFNFKTLIKIKQNLVEGYKAYFLW